MTIYEPIDPNESFPQMEERILERWRSQDVFQKSLDNREGAPRFVFYEGPPTANGHPGSHHVLSRVFKDIFPRYKTMRGFRVDRKAGWDCHGLPVELEIERQLGLSSKHEIEEYGIAEFNAKCRESVFEYVEEWNKLTERIGFWIDLEDPYVTLSNDYVESVWWSLKQIWDQGLLYQGHRVVPYCPRCGTALSSHEVALGYKDLVDQSAYVRLPILQSPLGEAKPGDSLLVWTTTPWTLVANAAVAVGPDIDYVRARVGDEVVVVAAARALAVLGEDAVVLAKFKGSALVGTTYTPPFSFVTDFGPNGHQVYQAGFVTTDDGTGLVHIAPAFGEEDYRVGQVNDIEIQNPVQEDGTYDERVTGFQGKFVKELDPKLIEDLESRNLLFKVQEYEHSYPHCWRCSTPLIYYAKTSWYIKTTDVREQMLAQNQQIEWHPEHIKDGRFGKWLENNVDWALSRERYWGTPLPVWRCDNDHTVCVGSFAEISELGGTMPDDPHRPYIDDVTFDCAECGKAMQRVPEVIDAWYDSGSMPFAQWHYPFENEQMFKERFPADYICEAIDQTRGWFYSQLAVSTMLFGESSYRAVLCLGLILDLEGQKMSKSRGNVVVPWDVLAQHGADAFRWYYFTSKEPWAGYRFSVETVGESVRKFLLTLWNTFGFYTLYANASGSDGSGAAPPSDRVDIDRWALSRLQATAELARERLDGYDTTASGRAIAELVDELSNWYVRRSRRRFWNGDPDALATLRECLLEISKLLAPFTPFVADEIFTRLTASDPDAPLSVHLCDYPEPDPALQDPVLERGMAIAREAVELGRAARAQAKIKVRQPLPAAVVVADGDERAAIEQFETLIAEELNVKEVRYVTDADQLASFEVKPNFKALGPRFGKHMPAAKAAIEALDGKDVAERIKLSKPVGVMVAGEEHQLSEDDLQVVLAPLEGYELEREGSHAVALELALTAELIAEGIAREVVHAVQIARKEADFAVEDRIKLALGGDAELLAAAQDHIDYVAAEVLATDVSFNNGDAPGVRSESTVDGKGLTIVVERA